MGAEIDHNTEPRNVDLGRILFCLYWNYGILRIVPVGWNPRITPIGKGPYTSWYHHCLHRRLGNSPWLDTHNIRWTLEMVQMNINAEMVYTLLVDVSPCHLFKKGLFLNIKYHNQTLIEICKHTARVSWIWNAMGIEKIGNSESTDNLPTVSCPSPWTCRIFFSTPSLLPDDQSRCMPEAIWSGWDLE